MDRHCPECGARMQLKKHEREGRVGSFKVIDSGCMASVCESCGVVDMTLDDLQRFERRAARIVLLDRPDAGGDVYKYARKALGLRQVDLARMLGVEPETVSRWENGHVAMPRAEQLALVALLDVSEHDPDTFDRMVRGESAGSGKKLTIRAA
ncbi:MAG: helix-turn-helix domain-containing protein [Polyangiales bacterium]